jgi:hypothetical protein
MQTEEEPAKLAEPEKHDEKNAQEQLDREVLEQSINEPVRKPRSQSLIRDELFYITSLEMRPSKRAKNAPPTSPKKKVKKKPSVKVKKTGKSSKESEKKSKSEENTKQPPVDQQPTTTTLPAFPTEDPFATELGVEAEPVIDITLRWEAEEKIPKDCWEFIFLGTRDEPNTGVKSEFDRIFVVGYSRFAEKFRRIIELGLSPLLITK